MKNKLIIIIGFIVIICIILLVRAHIGNGSDDIINLLHEKYGEDFEIVHDSGNEYKSGLFPTFKKTGYKNVIAAPAKNKEIKFNVRIKLDPFEIERDDYIQANIAYNTSKIIEKNNKIGSSMYVHISAAEYKCEGKVTNSFYDNLNGNGSIQISIYVEGLGKNYNCIEYLNRIKNEFKFDNDTTGIIRLYLIKNNGIEKIKEYYKNNNDMVKVENSADFGIRNKYFEKPNTDYFIKIQ